MNKKDPYYMNEVYNLNESIEYCLKVINSRCVEERCKTSWKKELKRLYKKLEKLENN